MNKTQLSIIIGVSLSLVSLMLITSVYPNIDDLWVENPYWNGLSEFYSITNPVRLSDYGDLDSVLIFGDSTLFIIGPDDEFTDSELGEIKDYLVDGGRVVLADDFGSGNQVLGYLDIVARFDTGLLRDPIFKEKNSLLPRVTADYYGIDYLVLNYPTILTNVLESDVTIWVARANVTGADAVLWSSPLSYTTDSLGESPSSFTASPVIAEIPYYQGCLVVISDSSLFINSMIDKGGNKALLNILAEGDVIIDVAHTSHTTMSFVQSVLAKTYTVLGFFEVRYSLLLIIVVGILRVNLSVQETLIDPVEEVMTRHPEYDRKQLDWLEMERRKARGKL